MLIADSHEFIELYRGDKDLRVGMELVRGFDDVRFVSFAPDRLSPIDRDRFGKVRMDEVPIPELPERMELRLLPSRSIRFARKESGGIFGWMPSYRRELLALRPDVIFENPYSWLTPRSYQSAKAAARLGIPVVYYDPGDDIPISAKHRVMALWERHVVCRAKAIITYNEAGRSRFVRKYGYPFERIHVIPKPVDVAACRYEGDVSALRVSFGAGADDMVVGYVGRLASYKGSRFMLETARKALTDERFRNVRFVFIGGSLASAESDDEYRLANTHVTGMVAHSDVARHIAACDVVVFPDVTRPGGFPTAVAEAMAAAKALVVGIEGYEQFLPLVSGENAMLVAPSNTEAIAKAIISLAADGELRARLARAVGSFASRHMDYPVVVRSYKEILDAAVSQG